MAPTFRGEAIIEDDGNLILRSLPFQPGERVEVTVTRSATEAPMSEQPLRGTVIQYDDPTTPVAEEDWEVLR